MHPTDVLPPPFQSTRPQTSATPTPNLPAPAETNHNLDNSVWLAVVLIAVATVAILLIIMRRRFRISQI